MCQVPTKTILVYSLVIQDSQVTSLSNLTLFLFILVLVFLFCF